MVSTEIYGLLSRWHDVSLKFRFRTSGSATSWMHHVNGHSHVQVRMLLLQSRAVDSLVVPVAVCAPYIPCWRF